MEGLMAEQNGGLVLCVCVVVGSVKKKATGQKF